METQLVLTYHDELVTRRQKLEQVLSQAPSNENLNYLLREVDAALEKMDQGTYGLCEVCHDPIESERLAIDPLIRNCLDHLTAFEQRALERDLDLAFQIQQGLLPRNSIQYDGWHAAYHYEPAGAVSGDYCDIILPEDSSRSLLFNVGDVMGKGVAASILMAHLHAMFRSLMITDMPLTELVSRANRIFSEGTPSSHFATLVSGRADSHGEIEFCNAGHPYPLIIRADGVHEIASSALPIGVFCHSEFPSSFVHADRGDTLVLYTDGLTETMNASGEQYGEERLMALLSGLRNASPQGIIESCIRELKTFKGEIPKKDDVTIFVLHRD